MHRATKNLGEQT